VPTLGPLGLVQGKVFSEKTSFILKIEETYHMWCAPHIEKFNQDKKILMKRQNIICVKSLFQKKIQYAFETIMTC
jgi:hypothetical protein